MIGGIQANMEILSWCLPARIISCSRLDRSFRLSRAERTAAARKTVVGQTGEFEGIIMVEVAAESMVGPDRVLPVEIRSAPWSGDGKHFSTRAKWRTRPIARSVP